MGRVSYLHNCATLSQSKSNTLLILKSNSPNSLALSDQFSNEVAGLEVPDFNSTITTTTHNSSIVKL